MSSKRDIFLIIIKISCRFFLALINAPNVISNEISCGNTFILVDKFSIHLILKFAFYHKTVFFYDDS